MSDIVKKETTTLGGISSYILGDAIRMYDKVYKDVEGTTELGAFRNVIRDRMTDMVINSFRDFRDRIDEDGPCELEISQVRGTMTIMATILVVFMSYIQKLFKSGTWKLE